MNMIERVARALSVANDMDPDFDIDPRGITKGRSKFRWQLYVSQARAAIGAMREPNSEMVIAGDNQSGGRCPVFTTWYAMIDAALDEQRDAPMTIPKISEAPFAVTELDDLRDYAHSLQVALVGEAGGGSECFVRHGDEFRADIPFCRDRISERRNDLIEFGKRKLRELRVTKEQATIAERERDAAVEVLQKLDVWWAKEFPDGPEGSMEIWGGVARLSDETIQIWREIRAVTRSHPAEPIREIAALDEQEGADR